MKSIFVTASLCAALVIVPGFVSRASAAGKCPDKSTVKAISSNDPEFKAGQPNLTSVKSSKAMIKNGGKEVKVFLSNGSFTAKQMDNDMVLPIKKKGEGVVILKFTNASNKVAAGEYKPSAGYGKPFFVSADVMVKGTKPAGTVITFVAGGSSDKGSATITEITDKKVCGKFDMTGGLGSLSGEFAADIEK